MIRGYAAEFGVVAAKGLSKAEALLRQIAKDDELPPMARDLSHVSSRTLSGMR